jgi:hypothetical protein
VRIDLPSGNWVDIDDKLKAKHRFAVQEAVKFKIPGDDSPDRRQEIAGGVQNTMRNALLTEIITAWSFEGIPIPRMNIAPGPDVIGEVMDLDDYNELADKIQFLLDKVGFTPVRRSTAS